jgi:[NiFe] hydrogenase diaphorase moiety small subunit
MKTIKFTVDGKEIVAYEGQTIMQACDQAGVYIPRLCAWKDMTSPGACRVCTVKVNGRCQTSCTEPVRDGMVIENETEEILQIRRDIVDMMFTEGNHFCMFCEKSGNCELQAVAYRLGITAPRFPFQFPIREVDASHPEVMLDKNRCIQCGRCIFASRELDKKNVFQFKDRGKDMKLAVNAASGLLKDTEMSGDDKSAECCPVGCIIKKHIGFKVPIGQRLYDHEPIGSDVEKTVTSKENPNG